MKNNNFDNLGSVLSSLKQQLGLDYGVKQQEFARLWAKIVGPKFQNSSKVAYIYSKYGSDVLMVGVSSSVVAQELTFFKNDILEKIKTVAKDFNYNIKEIYFDPKLWEELKTSKNSQEESEKQLFKLEKHFTEEELEKIELPQSVIEHLKNSVEEEIMLNTIIKDLKKQEWMKKNGFPMCEDCGIPIRYFSPEGKNLCPVCKFKN